MSNNNLALYTIINSNKAKRKLRHQYVLPKFNSDDFFQRPIQRPILGTFGLNVKYLQYF